MAALHFSVVIVAVSLEEGIGLACSICELLGGLPVKRAMKYVFPHDDFHRGDFVRAGSSGCNDEIVIR